MKKKIILLLSLFLILPISDVEGKDLKIVVQENNLFFEAILPSIMKIAGIDYTEIRLPSERALNDLDTGVIDGNGLRLRVLDGQYLNIVRVKEPVEFLDFIAITNQSHVKVETWADLAKYKVAYPKGWKIFEANVPQETQSFTTNKQAQLFQLLRRGRVDVVLLSRTIADKLRKDIPIKGLRYLSPPLKSTPAYLYMHKSKKVEASKLSKALRKLKSTQAYGEIYWQVYGPRNLEN